MSSRTVQTRTQKTLYHLSATFSRWERPGILTVADAVLIAHVAVAEEVHEDLTAAASGRRHAEKYPQQHRPSHVTGLENSHWMPVAPHDFSIALFSVGLQLETPWHALTSPSECRTSSIASCARHPAAAQFCIKAQEDKETRFWQGECTSSLACDVRCESFVRKDTWRTSKAYTNNSSRI